MEIFPIQQFLKKSCAGLLATVLLSSSMTAYALSPTHFSDVSSDSPYAAAVAYCAEKGYVNGYGDGRFGPEDSLNMSAFLSVLCRIYYPDELGKARKTKSWPDAVSEVSLEQNLLTLYELQNKACTWGFVLDILLYEAGLPLYSSEAWGNQADGNGWKPNSDKVYHSAKQYGLLEGLDVTLATYEQTPNRAEFLQLIQNLQNSVLLEKRPPVASKIEIGSADTDILERDRNNIYEALNRLPEKYLDDFSQSGWALLVSNEALYKHFPELSDCSTVMGMTSFREKRIYAYSDWAGVDHYTVLHEFGHFASARNSAGPLPIPIFDAEKDVIETFLRPYAASSRDEAFADIFAYYCQWAGSAERIAALEKTLPQSSAFVKDNYFPEIAQKTALSKNCSEPCLFS